MTLTDTGPLVALLHRRDAKHELCHAATRSLPDGPLITTWPCFTEAMHLLGRAGGHRFREALWHFRALGPVELEDLSVADADRAAALMKKYADAPMDLADATLIAVAERRGLRRIFTLDKHFHIYRTADGSALEMIPG